MSRQELAEAVNAYIFATTKRVYTLNAHYVGRLERGARRWPNADYRAGFRAVLGVATDAGLGFFPTQRTAADVVEDGITWSEPVPGDTAPMQLVVRPGTAVIVVPSNHPVLLTLVTGK